MWCIDHLQREQEDLESKDTRQSSARNLRIRDDTEKVCNKGHVGNYQTFKAPIATKVVCFSRLLKCLRSLYDKQCGPRSDCS